MPAHDDILIVGGYGVVGRMIAQHIAPVFPGRLLIAGRDAAKAKALCRALGNGARPRALNINDTQALGGALAGVGTVMVCAAQRTPHLLHAAAANGLAYTDLSPRLQLLSGIGELEQISRKTGARILLGTGLSPGISNVMARQLANELGSVERILTAIFFSLGDTFGEDSLRHVFESLERPFGWRDHGHMRSAQPFGEPLRLAFPDPIGWRTTYTFPWSDVVYYPKTLGARTAIGRIALDPAWLASAAELLARAHVLPRVSRVLLGGERSLRMRSLKQHYAAHNDFSLVVEAEGAGRTRRMSLVGKGQARATAAGASEMLRMLVAGEIAAPGLWFAEQVVVPERFFRALARSGWHVQINAVRDS